MKQIKLLIVFLLTLSCIPASAAEQAPVTGTDLQRDCQFVSEVSGLPWGWEVSDVNQSVKVCHSFMNKMIKQQAAAKARGSYCLPQDIDTDKLVPAFMSYAKQYPHTLKKDANSAVVELLGKAYPCK